MLDMLLFCPSNAPPSCGVVSLTISVLRLSNEVLNAAISTPSTVPDTIMFALIVWFPVNVLAPKPAKLPVAVTPPCHVLPLYTLNSLEEVLKYRSPAASELPPPSCDGLEDAI